MGRQGLYGAGLGGFGEFGGLGGFGYSHGGELSDIEYDGGFGGAYGASGHGHSGVGMKKSGYGYDSIFDIDGLRGGSQGFDFMW